MSGNQRVSRNVRKAPSRKSKAEHRLKATQSMIDEEEVSLRDANIAVTTQRARINEGGTSKAARERLENAQSALKLHRDSVLYENASEAVSAAEKGLEKTKKLNKPTPDSRQILHPGNAGESSLLLPPPASAAINMTNIVVKYRAKA
jgi:hypothetical protein